MFSERVPLVLVGQLARVDNVAHIARTCHDRTIPLLCVRAEIVPNFGNECGRAMRRPLPPAMVFRYRCRG